MCSALPRPGVSEVLQNGEKRGSPNDKTRAISETGTPANPTSEPPLAAHTPLRRSCHTPGTHATRRPSGDPPAFPVIDRLETPGTHEWHRRRRPHQHPAGQCHIPRPADLGHLPETSAASPPRFPSQRLPQRTWCPYFAAAKLCHPCPCRPRKRTLYATPAGAAACISATRARRLAQRAGEVSSMPNERSSCFDSQGAGGGVG
jgi:hypothetical protein